MHECQPSGCKNNRKISLTKLYQIRQIFAEFLRDYPLEFIALIALLCIEGVIVGSSVLALAPLADFLIDPDLVEPSRITAGFLPIISDFQLEPSFLVFSVIFFGINLLKGFMDVLMRYSILRIKYRVLRGLVGGTLSLFLQARWTFFSGAKQGKLLNTFNRELVTIGDTFGHITTQFAQIFQLFIYLIVPFWLNPLMTLTALGVSVTFGLPFLLFHRLSYRLGKRNTETGNIAMSILSESLASARLILGFAVQNETLKRYFKAFDAHVHVTLGSQTLLVAINSFFQPISIAAGLIAMGIALSQGFAIAELAAILWSFLRAMPILSALLQTNVSLSNFLPSYEQLVDLRTQAEKAQDVQGSRNFNQLKQGLELREVSFAYPGRKRTLDNVNLRIRKGQMTALVGESGSGKSTLTDLLIGLQVPDRGLVLLEEYPLSEWDRNSFRERIGYVPQDPQLFHTTLRENLLWSKPGASEHDLWESCLLANAKKFVEDLPQGLDTIVGDRGIRLSGGQRQRIALARALLRQPDLLILDEATSSLDSKSEKMIQASLQEVTSRTTMFVIAHRLSTIAQADSIYVLHEGKILESGTYSELRKSNSHFMKMVRLQQFAD